MLEMILSRFPLWESITPYITLKTLAGGNPFDVPMIEVFPLHVCMTYWCNIDQLDVFKDSKRQIMNWIA